MFSSSLQHQLLLAMPNQTGTYFSNTLTYICDHNEQGTLGLMINRPTDIALTELLGQFDCATNVGTDLVVLEGGPVQQERGFVLHSADVQTTGSMPIGNDLLLTASREILEIIGTGDGPKQFMVALGYAGWGEGQLENELANNAWLTVPATSEILFDTPFDQRIDSAAKSLGIDFQLMSPHLGHA